VPRRGGPPPLRLSGEALPGSAIRVTADWRDPDYFDLECWYVDFGDGSPIVMAPEFPDAPNGPSGDCRTNEQPHFCERQLAVGNGPQPFDPAPGSETVVVEHTYAPGTYEITFTAISAWTMCPTASDVTATLTITVP
jgi:hypothetical protein